MFREKIIEPIGFIVAAASFLFSFILFYTNAQVFGGSIMAAAIAAGLFWVTYVIMRIFILAIRRQ